VDHFFTIGAHRIGRGARVFVVAEIGINHGGDPERCAQMIEAAARAGADAVKLQTLDVDESYVEGTDSYRAFCGTELSDESLAGLMRVAERAGVVLFSTPGDFGSLARIMRLGMPAVKISSGLMTNLPLIAEAARHRVPVIMSTGLAFETEIETAVATARAHGAPGVALLKCTALYPAPDESLNLSAVTRLVDRFDVAVGYSDHTVDGLACAAAVALGASVIEKHFTLDRTLPGADHVLSMEPADFLRMVGSIRRVETMRGSGALVPTSGEQAVRAERHRCLVARCDIAPGEVLSAQNVALKRPRPGQVGLAPAQLDAVLGKVARLPLSKNDVITADHVST